MYETCGMSTRERALQMRRKSQGPARDTNSREGDHGVGVVGVDGGVERSPRVRVEHGGDDIGDIEVDWGLKNIAGAEQGIGDTQGLWQYTELPAPPGWGQSRKKDAG